MRAKKSLGQHFLVDERVIDQIVTAVDPRHDETIVEIGPGRGALTFPLLRRAGRLVAIEFDRDLAQWWRVRAAETTNLTVVEEDALNVDVCSAVQPARAARLVANLPYYISTAILQHLIFQRCCLDEMTLMLQREVVERVVARPGSPARGFLSVLVEGTCETEKLFDVAPSAFRPAPKVWSGVVRMRPWQRPIVPDAAEPLLWDLARAGFAQRRKTILNNLRHPAPALGKRIENAGGAASLLDTAGVGHSRRAETLTIEEWAHLAMLIAPEAAQGEPDRA